MSSPTVCRCCLSFERPCRDFSSPYEWLGTHEVYDDLFIESFCIKLKQTHNTEVGICEACIQRLRDAVTFKRQVLAAEDQLEQTIERLNEVKKETTVDDIEVGGPAEALDLPSLEDELDNDTLPLSTFTKAATKKKVEQKNGKRKRSDPLVSPAECSMQSDKDSTNEHIKERIRFASKQEFLAFIGPEPRDYFSHFLDEDIMQLICMETNLHAQVVHEAWKEVTLEELKIFLGLLLHMGTIRLSKIRNYWRTDYLFGVKVFKENMELCRFLQILKYLRFSHGIPDDPIANVREIMYYFNEKMDRSYCPDRELIMEGVGLKNGVFTKSGLTNRCRRLYLLKDREGIVIRMCLVGKKESAGSVDRNVLNLLKGKLNIGHSVFTDKYFASVNLARQLLQSDTYLTCVASEKLLEKFMPSEIKMETNHSNGVHVGVYKSKKPLAYITTEFEGNKTFINTKGLKCVKPEAIVRYKSVVGVKRNEEFGFYPCRNTKLRWYKKVFVHMLQVILLNSFKFYSKYSNAKLLTLEQYRQCVVESLLPRNAELNQLPAQFTLSMPILSSRDRPINVEVVHTVSKIEERNSSGRIKRKMCRMCSRSGKRADSIYQCLSCAGQPGLCFACFDPFHAIIEQ